MQGIATSVHISTQMQHHRHYMLHLAAASGMHTNRGSGSF